MKKTLSKATKTVYTILRQIATLIPREFVEDAALEHKVQWRSFDPWSHLLTLVIVQLSRQESLNGICDVARALEYEWKRAGLELPHRNTLSNANTRRIPEVAEDVFWRILGYFKAMSPDFCTERFEGYLSRIKKHRIFLLDSSTIQLTLDCFDWARHRRQKAAAKLHMTMELASRLPSFAIVEDAAHHDSTRAAACTAHLGCGDILVADRAYLDIDFLNGLAERGASFVVRMKRNMLFKTEEKLQEPCGGDTARHATQILSDEKVRPEKKSSAGKYKASGGCMRRIVALVEVRGEMKNMTFLTSNFDWSARTVAELYRARWGIETFFKELKQTCQIHDFIGYSENAVKWQVWAGLIAHLLLRYISFQAKWRHSFSRLAGVVRGSLWLKKKLLSLLDLYGTASGVIFKRQCVKPLCFQLVLQFANAPNGTAGVESPVKHAS